VSNLAKKPIEGIRTLVHKASPRSEMEQWFIRRGLPHFIEPYSAGPDVWSRAAPVLVVAYIAGGLHGLDLAHWSLQRNLIGAGVVLAILLATWVVTNLARRRPPLSRPRQLGPVELGAFLVGPAIPPMVFTQWGDAIQALIEGVAVLTVIYFVTSYGVVPLVGWAAKQTFSRLGSVGRVLSRAMPLLLLFTTFLFINAEVWQVAGVLHGPAYVVSLSLFFLLGSAFVLSRVPEGIRIVHTFDDWAEVAELVKGTPAEGLQLPVEGDPMEARLSRRQRVNIGLVSVLSQAILITIVAILLAGFFTLFGVLAIPEVTTGSWTATDDVHVLANLDFGGHTLVLTEALLRVSGFLGAFAGMYFTVVLSTDATYRDEFAEDTGPQIRQALAVRLAYRHASGTD
jgi:hypothetical protein